MGTIDTLPTTDARKLRAIQQIAALPMSQVTTLGGTLTNTNGTLADATISATSPISISNNTLSLVYSAPLAVTSGTLGLTTVGDGATVLTVIGAAGPSSPITPSVGTVQIFSNTLPIGAGKMNRAGACLRGFAWINFTMTLQAATTADISLNWGSTKLIEIASVAAVTGTLNVNIFFDFQLYTTATGATGTLASYGTTVYSGTTLVVGTPASTGSIDLTAAANLGIGIELSGSLTTNSATCNVHSAVIMN